MVPIKRGVPRSRSPQIYEKHTASPSLSVSLSLATSSLLFNAAMKILEEKKTIKFTELYGCWRTKTIKRDRFFPLTYWSRLLLDTSDVTFSFTSGDTFVQNNYSQVNIWYLVKSHKYINNDYDLLTNCINHNSFFYVCRFYGTYNAFRIFYL